MDIKVPEVGESITEGVLARWLKQDGEQVEMSEPLYELETDKATQEVPAPAAGVLSIKVEEGETVEVGSVIGTLEKGQGKKKEEKPDKERAEERKEPSKKEKSEKKQKKSSDNDKPRMAPAARQLIADKDLRVEDIEGTGPGGRITKGDVLEHLEGAENEEEPEEKPEKKEEAKPSAPSAAPAEEMRESRERMSGIRQRIATRLVEAQQTAAILTTFNEIDMSGVMNLRGRFKEAFEKKHGIKLGILSFFVKAVAEALKELPIINARVEGNEIVTPHYQNIGIAVSTERGLMVPVLRHVERMSFADIESGVAAMAKKAREGKIGVNDLQGGTFTITNGGVFGSLLSTPILNPPQSGILGMHTIQDRPVAVKGEVVIRPMMYVALSYDHRIIDGRDAVGFLVRVKEFVESPERMLLAI